MDQLTEKRSNHPTEGQPSAAPQHSALGTRHFSRFDAVVTAVIVVLLAGIGLTVLLGDRVGVTVERVGPLGTARSTNRITMQFSEAMNRASVEQRFHTEPPLEGAFSWSGNTVIFQPAEPMLPGANVNVVLAAGATSDSGREVLSEYQYGFTVRTPRVAYLYPSDSVPQNIWIADPNVPDSAQQVTFSPTGVYDFAVSPDGSQIAFAENNANGLRDIKLLNLDSGALEQITNCADASCTTPVWRPDGNLIVYQRVDYNSDLASQGVGTSPTRLWVLDLTSRPVQTRPLFSDLQILGYDARWSADGNRITLFDRSSSSILVYDFTDGSTIAIPTTGASAGTLSDDGSKIVYEEMSQPSDGMEIRPYLIMANLDTNQQTFLSTPDQGFSDSWPVWQPGGEMLAIARRDDTVARGDQIYLLHPDTGEQERLTDDLRYTNSFFLWDATGTQLVIQRFPLLNEQMQPNNSGRPEVWTLDTATGTLTQIVANGYIPRWVP